MNITIGLLFGLIIGLIITVFYVIVISIKESLGAQRNQRISVHFSEDEQSQITYG